VTDLVLRSRRVVFPDGEWPATVHVRDGRIAEITAYSDEGTDVPALLPGLVDTHVHVNEPGRTEWEGFATATRAAAAGGVTTIVDMPLNSIPATVSVEALSVKRTAAEAARPPVDVGFWGGAVPGNGPDLPALYEAGVFGFKCFLIDSGVPEFAPLDGEGLDLALSTVDALFIVHAEDSAVVVDASPSPHFADFMATRPPQAETRAIATAIEAARRHGARVHILHLSAADALPLIAAAQQDGLRVTAETCPHYLTLDAADVPDGATEYKCCPPIRDAANREALWKGLSAGTISCVVSDHSPCSPELKVGDFATAWGGIASVQLGLPVVWTAARERAFPLTDVVRWMATAPADLVGLHHKGRIAVGAEADLVAFDPDEEFEVDPSRLHHRHPVTPYAGARLFGTVRSTWVRGVPAAPGTGRLITREEVA
jgi:allantoinase